MQDDRLENRHILVTGAAQGIGRGIALRVARAGADVSLFDPKVEEALQTADRVRALGGKAGVWDVDIAREKQIRSGLEEAVAEMGPVDGLVNNAGVQKAIPILETTAKDWDFHQRVNARGTFLCSRHVVRHMIEQNTEGSIVNIASVAAERPFPGQGAYAASKAAVVALTVVLAKELGEHGITANAINPATVDTPMVQNWLEEHARQEERSEQEVLAESLDYHILDRIGRPEEIGHMVVLLLSEEGDWITGETINVDAGYTTG